MFYITGGSHHSVAIDLADHIVVVEGPQSEARSLAVIAKVKETIPNKPIRYLINSHVHFDHSGGLRTWVDEGATIVTHELNKPYYEQAWAAPRTLNPDRLAKSQKAAQFQTFGAEPLVLTDGKRRVEVHAFVGNGHNDAFAMVYLPAEKILIEVDAYAPPAANAPMPAVPSPFAVNLHDNILRLKLDVRQIAPLHGPCGDAGGAQELHRAGSGGKEIAGLWGGSDDLLRLRRANATPGPLVECAPLVGCHDGGAVDRTGTSTGDPACADQFLHAHSPGPRVELPAVPRCDDATREAGSANARERARRAARMAPPSFRVTPSRAGCSAASPALKCRRCR